MVKPNLKEVINEDACVNGLMDCERYVLMGVNGKHFMIDIYMLIFN